MHKHVSRGQTLQKNYLPPPPLNAEKVRKWGFGPIHKKGKRNGKNEANTSPPTFPNKVSTPLSPHPS